MGYISNYKQDEKPFADKGDLNIDFLFNPISGKNASTLRSEDSGTSVSDKNPVLSEVEINGIKMLTLSINYNPTEGGPIKKVNYYFDYKGNTYKLSASAPPENSTDLFKMAEAIVKTFEFTH